MKFKKGDRVAVYDCGKRYVGRVVNFFIDPDGVMDVETEINRPTSRCHPKQCRLLKKKERRRVWVDLGVMSRDARGSHFQARSYNPNAFNWIEFIEVKRKI